MIFDYIETNLKCETNPKMLSYTALLSEVFVIFKTNLDGDSHFVTTYI